MNVSYNWLKDYLKFDLSPEEVSKALTSIGLETDGVEEVQTVKGGLEGLVVGEVLTCVEHPNSDHLHITTVNVGADEPLQIVCGAPNVATGQKVIVALVGATLHAGEEPFKIKKSKIRGEESFGMICAEDEIGMGVSHDGIIVLPSEVVIGTLAKDYYNIKSDYILEVDITPNRVDGASQYGVARDLAAFLTQNKLQNTLSKPSVDAFKIDDNQKGVSVKVENKELCPRYAGLTIKGIEVKESPDWLKDKLQTIGLRPINNVVDATNYVLHEFGHPLHAFDVAMIEGGEVIVKTLPEDSKFTTLDGQEISLSEKDLMICNSKEGMCIAGVFGGLKSGVTEKTTDIFLESAYFNPTSVRKTARRHGLSTDSSFRFERGCDPNDTIYVLKRAALLIQELAGGNITGEIQDIYPTPIDNFKVELAYAHVNRLIGKEIGKDTVKSILKSLEIEILNETDATLSLSVPTYRVDVQRDVDVIEDILRIYGYNNVEIGDALNSNLSHQTPTDKNTDLQNIVSEQLTGVGFYEILNNSLTKQSYYTDNSNYPESNCVKLINALSNELSIMRQTLLFGGLETIAYNRNRKNADLKLYEFGNCYFFDETKRVEGETLKEYSEEYHLGLWLTGNNSSGSWIAPDQKTSVYELKAHVENLLLRLGLSPEKYEYEQYADDIFEAALTIQSKGKNKDIGKLGILRKKLLKKFDINAEVFYAELNWDMLMKDTRKHKVLFSEISKYPSVERDFALLIDKNVLFEDIEKLARKVERKLLKEVTLFDVYEGDKLPEGKKSYAVKFIIQDTDKTLTDVQIDGIMQKIQKTLEQELGAQLR